MKTRLLMICLAGALLSGCASDNDRADAYGNFEAVEILVSAEASGRLVAFDVREGQSLQKGETVAVIDTTLLDLKRRELDAARGQVHAKINSADAQIAVLEQQRENTDKNLQRVQNMVQDSAATQKQLDDLQTQRAVLLKQIDAARAQRRAVAAELTAMDAREAQLDEQIARSTVTNPVNGTVLQTYAEPHELAAAGKPLYKIADLQNMSLTVYVSGGQLHDLKIGQTCTVRIDKGDDYIEYSGSIAHIAAEAEFTPKIIQTKEERVDLVYAVKIDVENDGAIKIGMPGDVIF